jgi:hypothetical protein
MPTTPVAAPLITRPASELAPGFDDAIAEGESLLSEMETLSASLEAISLEGRLAHLSMSDGQVRSLAVIDPDGQETKDGRANIMAARRLLALRAQRRTVYVHARSWSTSNDALAKMAFDSDIPSSDLRLASIGSSDPSFRLMQEIRHVRHELDVVRGWRKYLPFYQEAKVPIPSRAAHANLREKFISAATESLGRRLVEIILVVLAVIVLFVLENHGVDPQISSARSLFIR